MDRLILRCALQNAVKYNGRAEIGSVLGLVFSQTKGNVDKKSIIEKTKKVISEVNRLSLVEQKDKLKSLGEIKKKAVKTKFPKLCPSNPCPFSNLYSSKFFIQF